MYRQQAARLIIATLLLSLAFAGCEPRREHLVEQHWLEFGTIITLTLITPDLEQAETVLDEIEADLRRYRGQWHAWEDSDLSRFNTALRQGERVPVPASLAELLTLSRRYHDLTGGRFDPALGSLVAAEGFHAEPADPAVAERLRQDLPGLDDLVVEAGYAYSRHRDLRLDFGGIAKGYALRLIGDRLEQRGFRDYLLNAGGDIRLAGNRLGRPWRIGIQNPWAPGAIASVELEGSYSLFTSGNYRRTHRRGGETTHHIFDPRSGRSTRGLSSVTVLARDPVLADAAATALMVDGLSSYAELGAALQIADFMLITDSREIVISRVMSRKTRISASWKVEIVN